MNVTHVLLVTERPECSFEEDRVAAPPPFFSAASGGGGGDF
jgi:hypothetical protein